jgi:hypothetical protein
MPRRPAQEARNSIPCTAAGEVSVTAEKSGVKMPPPKVARRACM